MPCVWPLPKKLTDEEMIMQECIIKGANSLSTPDLEKLRQSLKWKCVSQFFHQESVTKTEFYSHQKNVDKLNLLKQVWTELARRRGYITPKVKNKDISDLVNIDYTFLEDVSDLVYIDYTIGERGEIVRTPRSMITNMRLMPLIYEKPLRRNTFRYYYN